MTENKVEILPLVAEDHELITTKLDDFNFDKDDAEKLEDTLINCMTLSWLLVVSKSNWYQCKSICNGMKNNQW